MRITAAVTRAQRSRFLLEERELGVPGPGEILLRVAASGICHTDLICRDGRLREVRPADEPGERSMR